MNIDDELTDRRLDLKALTLFRERLWPYMRRYRGLFALSTTFVLLSTACALATPWLLGYAVDHVLVPKRADLLVAIALTLFGIDLIRAASQILQNYLLTLFGQNVLHDLRQDLLRQYEFYPVAEFNRTPTGRLVTRLVNDTSSLQELFTGGFAVALGEVAVIVGIVFWLIVLHPSLGLVCVSVFPLMILAARVLSRQIRETYRQSRAALSRLNSYLSENIAGMPLIQVFNQEPAFEKRFSQVSSHFTEISIRNVEAFAFLAPSITILSSLSMALLIWFGGYRSLHETVTLGLLVAFMSYLQALYAPIRDITEKYNLFVSAMTSCERIFEFMDRPREQGTDSATPDFPKPSFAGAIEFRNVWFRYDEKGKWILRDLSFAVKPGEQLGIVGQTGAGKTTLSALLMRFYDVERGEILLDGTDIRKIDKRTLRRAFGYIQQDAFLFSGTVEENILLWDESRREALKSLPVPSIGLSKRIFEKGANLSSGERQVIAFLRALAQDPSVLVLDEATAHVDSLTERWVSDVSATAFRTRTVFIIAHRLATLKSVNRIIVLHHGELVESGSHQELLALGGIYRKLHDIQSRREELTGSPSASAKEPTKHL